jgi:hypothetical protein
MITQIEGSLTFPIVNVTHDASGNITGQSFVSNAGIGPRGLAILDAGQSLALGATGIQYNGNQVSWANLQTKIQAIAAISPAPNATTLAIDNTIQMGNLLVSGGDTLGLNVVPTPADLTSTGLSLPIVLDGVTYYLMVYSRP